MRFAHVGAAIALLVSVPAYAADVEGSTSGTFTNPQPGTATTTGVGTNDFTYGSDATGGGPNQLTFTGTTFEGDFETPFKIGSLYYYNGTVNANSGADSVDLNIALNFSVPALPAFNSAFTLGLFSTLNTGDPDGDADYVYFPASYGSGSFLIGDITYYVALTGFQNIVGDGFLTSTDSVLHVRENSSATADLYAMVTATAPPPAVPEPSSWALMLLGFGTVGYAMRRRNREIAKTIRFA